ncbi:MAG: hypothetical protein NT159_07075, partial [Proteobacteria bacterium]|nr:hypothetical protein [Pseudomonadota bacterium]
MKKFPVVLSVWTALAACAVAAGLVACSGSESGPPPFRELVLLAGTLDEGGPGHQDGVGTAARFGSPVGLAFDAQDNLFVADMGNQLLRKITPEGMVSTVLDIATLPGTIDADGHETVYSQPTQVAVDPQGRLHVALSQTVWSRSRAAVAADPSNPGNSPLSASWAVLRVAPDGSIKLVADPVRQYSVWSIGGIPTALVFDALGSFYTAGAFGCTIFKGDASSQLSVFTQFGFDQDRTGCLKSNSWTFGVASIALNPGGRLCLSTVDGKVGCTKASGEVVTIAQIPGSLG